MRLKCRSYVIDDESIAMLKRYAEKQKISESAALRRIITKICGGENVCD